jgi:hypothetical protein
MISANYLKIGKDNKLSKAIIPDVKAMIARSSKVKFEIKLRL